MDLKEKICRRLGYLDKPDPKIDRAINIQLSTSQYLIEPYKIAKDIRIKKIEDGKIFLEPFTIYSHILARALSKCDRVTIFAVTIGDKLESQTDDLVINLIRDAIGSESVEALADKTNKEITERAKDSGYRTLPRFSCGYGDWELSDQKKVIDFLKPSKITLTDKSYMVPKKSITAIVGWIKE